MEIPELCGRLNYIVLGPFQIWVDDAMRSPEQNEKLQRPKFNSSGYLRRVNGPLMHQAGKPDTGLLGLVLCFPEQKQESFRKEEVGTEK